MRLGRELVGSILLLAAGLLAGACRAGETQQEDAGGLASSTDVWDPAPHRSEYVRVNGVRLNYLDYGGKGPTLLMVHGIGDNPHIFDDLAPRLTDSFHVIAYARRGHGDSDAPTTGPYDVETLIEDLRQLMDSLRIRKAHLLGWSMGGDEITSFAGRYPDRTGRLVYLEAGYDYADTTFLMGLDAMRSSNTPDSSALASFDEYQRWFRTYWLGDVSLTSGVEAYLRNNLRVSADGSVERRMADSVYDALWTTLGAWPREYTSIRAPVLALYASTYFPSVPENQAHTDQMRYFEEHVIVPFRDANIHRLRTELPDARIQWLDGTTQMSIGIRQPAIVAGIIRQFLLERP